MTSTPNTVMVTGSFFRSGKPVQGLVRFLPSRLWVVVNSITWACLAPTLELEHGRFMAYLTATDNDPVRFTYVVQTPAGTYETYAPYLYQPYTLPELLTEHGVRLHS